MNPNNPQDPYNPQDPRQAYGPRDPQQPQGAQSPQYQQPPADPRNPQQVPYPPQYQQQPGWGTPPPVPQPPRRNTGKIVGFSCLGVLALFVVLGIVGAAVGGGDDEGKKSTASSGRAEGDSPKGDAAKSGKGDKSGKGVTGAEDDTRSDAKSTGSQADQFKACVAKKGTAGEKAAVAHVTKVTGTDKRNDILDSAEVFTDFTGGFMSADAGDAKLITSAFTSCYESDNGLVTVYGSDGDMITNGNY
ncbi:hypothetical protein [Streptomyces sp. B3I8]|uniref:hypothetical protein n=1 Tax=Streptomyces sp. B3I8 TaxID=3042303 RepID=UPI002784CB05|nr:hypothetical protein [Streptomyces sp. B3I8]MDQ0790336.1 hypothetical protein [Streptomyces sp. B3I8]